MNVGFVSTRLAGTDGVSLETGKWATIFERLGHKVYYCAGELDPGLPGLSVPEMHFTHPEVQWIHDRAFGSADAVPDLGARITSLASHLRESVQRFVSAFELDLLIVENALAIPMNIPLGLALTEFIVQTHIPTIAHHHDFYWERERFLINCVGDMLDRAFPPDLPGLRHVVINSIAQGELRRRRGIDSAVVPNVFDFDTPAPGVDEFNADLRADLGLDDDDLFILQPTRVVPRKGIELAIELLRRLGQVDGRHPVLVITHQAGDEGLDYLQALQNRAQQVGVDLRHVADRFGTARRLDAQGGKVYVLWDAYVHADFVTYPSRIEGFGNALIETIYFKKPALVNRYPVYAADIGPLGFDFVEIDGAVTDAAVEETRDFLTDPERRRMAVERNFRLGREHFSYQVLREKLGVLLNALPFRR
ncbi:MAG: glycosyltransferase family 4 protein [Anaerolineae bacterium]|nr:glycosyltransferase family 4 protein [Anaerolineae bacterium]